VASSPRDRNPPTPQQDLLTVGAGLLPSANPIAPVEAAQAPTIDYDVPDIASLPARKAGRQRRARVRLPVTGTVEITPLEAAIIDTRVFQRLRKIRQLGGTYVVYPGANHSRFEHCLGVVQMSNRICDAVQLNDGISIAEDDRKVIRLASLLHDIGHLAFGHTLEDEIRLFAKHDSDARLSELLEVGEIADVFKAYSEDSTLKEVVAVLRKDAIGKLPKNQAFRADIVANTVCADLLDYLRRDFYHLGIAYNFDDRLFDYMTLALDREGRRRFGIRLVKGEKFRHDATTQIVELLNLRYMLAECALFHHAKDAHSAMLGRALLESEFLLELASSQRTADEAVELRSLYQNRRGSQVAKYFDGGRILSAGELSFLGDDELVARLARDSNAVAQRLATMIEARQLYRTYAEIDYDTASYSNAQGAMVSELHQSPQTRFALERVIEDELGLPRGSILLYCPSEKMNLKVAEVHVVVADTAVPLSKYENENQNKLTAGFLDAQLARFRRLWRTYLFVHPAIPDAAAERASQYLRARYFLSSSPGRPLAKREHHREREYRKIAVDIFAERNPDLLVSQLKELESEQLVAVESRGADDTRRVRNYLDAFALLTERQ
jgi:hypothetical protein